MFPCTQKPRRRAAVHAAQVWLPARPVTVLALAALGLVLGLLLGCGQGSGAGDGQGVAGRQVVPDQLVVATTTSVKDSGLMDELVLPAFAEAHPEIDVKLVAVGSGEAMVLGERGEADVLVVHSPQDEEAFMAQGHGTLRLPVARNYFAIVGPREDPADVGSARSAAEAMRSIAASQALFVSRGDASGTHTRELALWRDAGVEPAGDRYIETGQGMGETLRITNEKQGYTLTDLSTYLTMRHDLDLVVLSQRSPELANRYSVIVVNQNRHPAVNAAAAELFAGLLVSERIQHALRDFGVAEVGQPLFYPDADSLGE